MVRSMTGFGRATSDEGKEKSFSVEIKSVNHRYLDINIRMPRSMFALEDKMRKIISEKLNRGKVDVFINCKNYVKGHGVANLNLEFAESYIACLEKLQKKFPNVKNDLSLSLIARHPEVIAIEEKEDDLEEIWQELRGLIESAIDNMISMRELEGEKLSQDIYLKCNEVEELVSVIERKSHIIVHNYGTYL